MPGVMSVALIPLRLKDAASWGEQTIPSTPHETASLARRETWTSAVESTPTLRRSASEKLVNTVTAHIKGRGRASDAAFRTAGPAPACTVQAVTPVLPAASTERRTWEGISYHLQSRNTFFRRRRSQPTSSASLRAREGGTL
jgi:hypothetical protein